MINALTIDVENYWAILQRDWLHMPDAKPAEAVSKNTRWYLQIFNEYNVKATFFILGEVAQSFPHLIKEIADEGHEIAVHGFYHRQIFKLSQDEFKKEVGDAKKLLEDLSGQQVIGHRAPAFSINKDTKWALEVLAELGFNYDSSVYPVSGRRYGWPGFSKDICRVDLPSGRSIIEVPLSTVTILGRRLPVGGGGYIRHFPYAVTKWAIRHIQKKRPAIIYMHPYEIDTDIVPLKLDNLTGQGKIKVFKFHKLQMRNRQTVKGKIDRLLSGFKFSTIKDILKNF
jgi:polysaccharide deacetylase family protein (PEP-CTERM system associated)